MKTKTLLTILAAGLFAVSAQAGNIRWHKYQDGSMYLEDDEHGGRLIMPEQYEESYRIAIKHYMEVNPDSVGMGGYSVTFGIRPDYVPSPNELANWAHPNSQTWWQEDLLTVIYRNLEERAQVASAEDPAREQHELKVKSETERMPAPSEAMIRRLATHGIHYTGKVYTDLDTYD